MVNSWTLLRLNAQKQEKYIEHVKETMPDVEVYFPVYDRVTRPHGKRQPIVVIRPVYPGYLFTKFDVDGPNVHGLVSAPVKARFIKFGPDISRIPDRVIWELKHLENLKVLVREVHVNPFKPGRKVRIHLPIADINAIIIQLAHGNRALVDTAVGRMNVRMHQMTLV
jgi:transcription antitermination factor NusG